MRGASRCGAAPALPGAPANPQPNLAMPSRQALHQPGASQAQGFTMPPGYVPEMPVPKQFSPLVFAAIGMGVMVLSYLTLMAFNPFK